MSFSDPDLPAADIPWPSAASQSGTVSAFQSARPEPSVDLGQGDYYIGVMIAFAHALRLRLPVVPTAGSFVVFAK